MLQCFNSIKVRLRLNRTCPRVAKKICFKSIKVRLRPVENNHPIGVTAFQFHKGTIKTKIR